jgi:hypothetical protein
MRIGILFLALLALLGQLKASPPDSGLRSVWQINLSERIREANDLFGVSTHSITTIAFSPNEEYIAVGIGVHPSTANPKQGTQDYFSHLVLIRTKKDSGVDFQQFEPGVLVGEKTLMWSPDSTTLLVNAGSMSVIIKTDGTAHTFKELGCLPHGSIEGFVDSSHFLTLAFPPDALRHPEKSFATLSMFDSDCRLLTQWSPKADWYLTDIEPRGGLAAAYRRVGNTREDFVFDLNSKRMVQRWENDNGQKFFAESARSLCSIMTYWRGNPGPVCWDVATGAKIADLPKVNGGLPASVSRYGSRILLSDFKVHLGVTEEDDMHEFKRRLIWDFRTGRELGSWVPSTQSVELPHHPAKEHAVLSAFALSPTGRFVAEGADGVLLLYLVEGNERRANK